MNYTIFVNTTDTFEDCWLPFFKLFKHYWPNYKGKIYLNTEYKDFNFEGLNISCLENSVGINKKLTWSECLLIALSKIDSENILYLQEDYFFNDFVQAELLNEFYEKFIKLNCECLHLTDQSTSGPYKETSDKMIWEIEKIAPYRISCQAAYWKKDMLRSYLRKHETAWHFEHYGTKRSTKKNGKFCVVNTNRFGCGKIEILPYVFTGIIKGKWNEKVKSLFENHNINVDYTKRGFFFNTQNDKTFLQKFKDFKYADFKARLKSEVDLILK